MRTCIIFNPVAKGNKARHFRAQLKELARDAELLPTAGPGGGRPLATQAVRNGFELIVAAGGDGTVNEVINGIGDAPEGFARACLGVLPLGTVNVFARELCLPLSLEGAWDVIRQSKEARLDLPQAEYRAKGQVERRYFAQLGGAGLDARAIALVDWGTKKWIGPWAYVIAGVKAVLEKKPLVTVDTGKEKAEGELVLIGNGRYYGGNFVLFPRAKLHDGLIDATVFPRTDALRLLQWGWDIVGHGWEGAGGARHLQGESITLSASVPVGVELEGDLVGELPARFSIAKEKLRVVC